ncbi:MAG: pyruvate kinase [Micrococcales bacterium]|nr:pyruvate kinase [Micrococcales bacterium]
MRRAKIVCTIGPASNDQASIRSLIQAGMNVARFNLSHGSRAEHAVVYHRVRKASQELGVPVAILADLQGPKIRLGAFGGGQPVELTAGDRFTITTEDVVGNAKRASTTYQALPKDTKPGDVVLIDDGNVVLRVESIDKTQVITSVRVGGKVGDHKGINLPGAAPSAPTLSAKDRADLSFALDLGVDWVALSYVRSAADHAEVVRAMDMVGVQRPVIAKIEKPQAVDVLEEIIESFDGVMVARGDLGVELPLEDVPLVQKRAIDLARSFAKPVIVATQMLESMTTNPRPTRAEASDCANAVLDGASALMLSSETSIGAYAAKSVQTMARIIEVTEAGGQARMAPMTVMPHTRSGILTQYAASIGDRVEAKYLVAFTETGDTARRLSRLRSALPMIAMTPDPEVRRQLSLVWGVEAFEVANQSSSDEMVAAADVVLKAQGLAVEGETIVIVSGAPVGTAGSTNQILVHQIGGLDAPVD